MKVVINKCFGGFSLSKKATQWLAEKGNKEAADHLKRFEKEEYWCDFSNIKRDDPYLIEVVELLGEEANGSCAKLVVEEVSFNIEDFIREYDGNERLEIPFVRTW